MIDWTGLVLVGDIYMYEYDSNNKQDK